MSNKIDKFRALMMVGGLAAANYYVIGNLLGSVGFNIGRVTLAAWGGWYLVYRSGSSLWLAALVGVFVLVVDHVILKGGYFLLAQLFWPESVENEGFLAFRGVMVSFLMFAPVAALVSFVGGVIGRKQAVAR